MTAAPTGLTAVERISALPGGGPDVAGAVIGEIGLDMKVFGTGPRLCSWAKISPRTVQSGRKTGKATTGSGNLYLKAALGQMAMGAAKTDTFFGGRYRRLAKRMPKAKALAALERSTVVVIFHLLADPPLPSQTWAGVGKTVLLNEFNSWPRAGGTFTSTSRSTSTVTCRCAWRRRSAGYCWPWTPAGASVNGHGARSAS